MRTSAVLFFAAILFLFAGTLNPFLWVAAWACILASVVFAVAADMRTTDLEHAQLEVAMREAMR